MTTFYKGAFEHCSWCNGRGCNQCHLERKKYEDQFKTPQALFSADVNDPQDMQLLKEVFGREALEHAFGPDGGGMQEIEQAAALASFKQAMRKHNKTAPTMACPQCGAEYEDFDGLGVLHCDSCGYCKHASVTDGQCDYCGQAQGI